MDASNPKRAALLDKLADHLLAHGLGAASLRPLAAAVGTSDRMLLYYFPDKAALIGASLETVARRMTVLLDAHRAAAPMAGAALAERLLPLVLDEALWPFMRLWLEIASRAAHGEADLARIGGALARGFLDWAGTQVDAPDQATRRLEATRVMMAVEGAVLLKSLGLGDEVAATLGGAIQAVLHPVSRVTAGA